MTATQIIAACTMGVGVTFLLLHWRMSVGRMIAPISTAVVMTTAIFGVRPLVQTDPGVELYGYSVSEGWLLSATAGLIGLVALIVGYIAAGGHARGDASAEGRWDWDWSAISIERSLRLLASYSLLTVVVWAAVIAWRGGGPFFLLEIFGGRSESIAAAIAGVPNAIWAAPMAGPIAMAALRFRYEYAGNVLRMHSRLLYWAACFVGSLPSLSLGGRRFLLPMLLAAVAGASAQRWSRAPRLMLVVPALAALFFLAVMPFVRSAGARDPGENLITAAHAEFEEESVSGVLESIFVSYDTEMFDYVALLSDDLGKDVPWGLGRATVGDLLLEPLPSALLPQPTWSDQLLIKYWGEPCGVGVCPVISLVGWYFADGWLTGVLVGMFLSGALLASFPRFLFREGVSGPLSAMVMLGFTPIVARGSPAAMLSIAFVTLLIGIGMTRVALRKSILFKVHQMPVSRAPVFARDLGES